MNLSRRNFLQVIGTLPIYAAFQPFGAFIPPPVKLRIQAMMEIPPGCNSFFYHYLLDVKAQIHRVMMLSEGSFGTDLFMDEVADLQLDLKKGDILEIRLDNPVAEWSTAIAYEVME